MLLSFKIF